MSNNKYSAYELVSPKWLNEEFLENILKQSESDKSIKVTSIKITPAAVNNDHYGSLMYRIKIAYSDFKNSKNTMSVVLKTMPEDDSIKNDLLKDTFIFETEIRIYSETIPRMEEELRKYGDNTKLGARMLYSSLKPHQVIVFEDLVEKGYTTLKNRMPTKEELEKVLLKLSKWHAVSYKLAQEAPESITTFNVGMFNMDLQILMDGQEYFVDDLLSSDDLLKQYIPHFKELNKTVLERCRDMCNAFKRGDKAVFVLNHGDVHVKNMMYKHSESGHVEDVMMVDFQCCYYGPAVSDVMYSMFMLWDNDIRWKHRDEMIYYYFSNFAESLKRLEPKGDVPKMADLQIDLINYRAMEMFLLELFLVLSMVFCNDSLELDKLIEMPDYKRKLYRNPKVIKEVKRCLPFYLQRGYLE